MNRDALRLALAHEGVKKSSYSIETDEDETYCLGIVPGGWTVWFSERGRRIDEVFYETEDEACSDLLLRCVGDPTTRSF